MNGEILRNFGGNSFQDSLWDDLLKRCKEETAACQAEVLMSFQSNFAPDSQLLAVVARKASGELVAGMPLLVNSGKRLFASATSVANEWCQCGQLLVSPDSDQRSALVTILDELSRLRLSSLWLDWTAYERPQWREFLFLAEQRGWGCQINQKFDVGITRLPESWADFEMSLSKNCRKRTRSELKRLSQQGTLRLEVVVGSQPGELASNLREAFDIEQRGWKGKSGSAIVSRPHVRTFFLNSAQSINKTGQFRLFLLRLNDQAIAFDLGEEIGSLYRSWKISYLPEFADYSPGHVLNQLVIRHFIENTSIKICDSVGPLTAAIRRWSNDQYRLGRIVIAPGTWLSNPSGHSVVQCLRTRAAVRNRNLKDYLSNRLRLW